MQVGDLIFKGHWAEIIGTEMIVGKNELEGITSLDKVNYRSKGNWNDEEEIGVGTCQFEKKGAELKTHSGSA